MPVFLLTDIEGSTQLWEHHGRVMGRILARHDSLFDRNVSAFGGHIVKHTGDGIFAVFEEGDPLACIVAVQQEIVQVDWGISSPLRIRAALHVGEAELRDGDYFGTEVNRTARVLSAAWGGQVLLTAEAAASLAIPAGATLRDCGIHLLRDLGEPQHVFSLAFSGQVVDEFPPLRTLSTRANNLPAQPTPFVGRARDLQEVASRLLLPTCRLLTIVGPGGIGKTRLAVQAAAEIVTELHHGVHYVGLSTEESGDSVVPAIADALRFPFLGRRAPLEQLTDYLAEKQLLLLLDGFERLIGGSSVLAELLQRLPLVKFLVTSRERLNLQGEWTYELDAMAVPPTGSRNGIDQYEAVQLFLQNARRVAPSFDLVAENKRAVADICRLTEGIPLGLELASAWVRVLSPSDIAREIQRNRDFLATTAADVPSRHRSLRATFENSWEMLKPVERDSLARLSVFHGGFEREAAEEVTGTSLMTLMALVDKSLLRHPVNGRFAMLETIRQSASDKLEAQPVIRRQTRYRHSIFYATFLARYADGLHGPAEDETKTLLEREWLNVRQAARHAIAARSPSRLRQFINGLYQYYELKNQPAEGRRFFREAGDALRLAPVSDERELVLGMTLARAGWFAYRLGDDLAARQAEEESLAILRALDAPKELAFTLYNLGVLQYQSGEHAAAEETLQESLAIRRTIGSQSGTARSLSILGIIAREQGRVEAARSYLLESLALYRALDDPRGVSRCLNLLALTHHDRNELHEAHLLLEESLAICRGLGDGFSIGYALGILGAVQQELGALKQARLNIEESLRLRQEIGDRRGVAFSYNDLGNIASSEGNFADAERYYHSALRLALDLQTAPLGLYVLTGLGFLYAEQGRPAEAESLALLVGKHPAAFHQAQNKAKLLLARLVALSWQTEATTEELSDFESVTRAILDRGTVVSSDTDSYSGT